MILIKKLKMQEGLTEREKDIAKYILEHPEQIVEMSSRELGHVTLTSAASVTRFCQKLGLRGFPEFKIKFVSELKDGQFEEEQEKITISERENIVTMVKKATKIQQLAVTETQKNFSYSQLIRVGRMIAAAASVDFYVYDTNIHLAQYGCTLFYHAGKRSSVYSAINIQGLHAVMPPDGHIAIIISHTGRNERLAEIEKLLKKSGTKIIAITSDEGGIIGKYADEVLTVAGAEKKIEEFWMPTFFEAGKYILDILYGIEFSRRYKENLLLNEKYEKTGKDYLWGLTEEPETF